MPRARVTYSGKVQGVWFRANSQKKAVELSLGGWVRNLPDGKVECVVEGSLEKIREFIGWNETEQPFARVNNVQIEWMDDTGEFTEFRIIR